MAQFGPGDPVHAPAPSKQFVVLEAHVVHVVPPAHAAQPVMALAAEHAPLTRHGVVLLVPSHCVQALLLSHLFAAMQPVAVWHTPSVLPLQ